MKRLALALFALTLPLLSGATQAETLTSAACQPLTDANRVECCSAANWRDIILPEALSSCDRSGTQNVQQPTDDAVGSVTTTDGTNTDTNNNTDTNTDTATDTGGNNPGNTSPVGGAGEKGMNTESPNPTGTQGNSN
jgi:hypothetical protein